MGRNPSIPVWFGFWVGLTYASLICHEAGHALAALAMRIPVRSIEVGTKWRIARVQLGRLQVTFRVLPSRGLTRVAPASSKAKRLIFATGGLVANVLLIAAGCVWFVVEQFPFIAFELIVVNALFVAENLWPRPARPPTRPHPSDGWTIFGLLFRSDEMARPTTKALVEEIVAKVRSSHPPAPE